MVFVTGTSRRDEWMERKKKLIILHSLLFHSTISINLVTFVPVHFSISHTHTHLTFRSWLISIIFFSLFLSLSITGEITSDSSPQTASSPSLQISPTASTNGSLSNSSELHRNLTAAARTKRKSATIHNSLQYSVDKMLNERNKLIAEDNKSFLQHTSSSTLKNNNNTSFNNNNNNNNNSFNGSLVSNNHHHNHNSSSAVAVAMKDLFAHDKQQQKYHPDTNMNVIKNGQLSPSTAQKMSQITLSKCLSNGTNKANGAGSTVKTERLSPPVVSDLSMYR